MSTKISSISISRFTVFEKNEIEFSPGLNVFIGKNGTGKTHLLKILYSSLKIKQTLFLIPTNNPDKAAHARNLTEVFKTDALTDLIRNVSPNTDSYVKLSFSNNDSVNLKLAHQGFLQSDSTGHKDFPEGIYIPPQEMLSWYYGFTALWNKREIDFDETYFQLATALGLPPLKNGSQTLNNIIGPLEHILDAKIVTENGRFYLDYKWGRISIHLAAEGFRKLATIIQLLANGSINEKTILFWDEPEVHFNPSLIEALVELIKGLTNHGVQIFITTHDYLLSQRLSLLAEYGTKSFPVKFFCFSNEKGEGVSIQEGNTLVDIDKNPILDEFAGYYDFERNLFKNSSNAHK